MHHQHITLYVQNCSLQLYMEEIVHPVFSNNIIN